MNKDLHDIDELFRSGLEDHEEIPSAGVKENLEAALDKKDAESYKKRFIIWKRTALLLLLLLSGFVLYESGILKPGSGSPDEKTAGKKINSSDDKQNPVYQKTVTDNTGGDGSVSDPAGPINNKSGIYNTGRTEADRENNTLTSQKPKSISAPSGIPVNNKRAPGNIFWKNSLTRKQLSLLTKNQKNETLFIQPATDKSINNFLTSHDPLLKEKNNLLQPVQKNSIGEMSWLLVNSIKQSPLPAVSDSLLKNSSAKNKKIKFFKPLWMITGFASYDQAGYRLDSDQPSAITSIKFREANEPSYSAGLLLTRQFTPRFGLQSGIVYRNTAIGMKPQKTYAFTDPTGDVAYKYITSSGYAFFKPGFGPQPAVGDSLTTAEGKHKLENISIPLMARYTVLSNKKISITAGTGMEANFITKANLEVDIEDPFNREIVVIRKLNGTKSFYGSFIADAEIKYNLNKKISINMRPVYRTALSPITKNNVVETFPHSFGIGAGVTIKL